MYSNAAAIFKVIGRPKPNLETFLRVTTDENWHNRESIEQLLRQEFIRDGEHYVTRMREQRETPFIGNGEAYLPSMQLQGNTPNGNNPNGN